MKGILRAAGVGLGLWLVLNGGPVRAQGLGGGYLLPNRRPAVSPYINLLRTGSDPAINYYGIVRPEVAFRSSINSLDQQQSNLANQQAQEYTQNSQLPPTGQGAGFSTQYRYFMTVGGRPGMGSGGSGGRPGMGGGMRPGGGMGGMTAPGGGAGFTGGGGASNYRRQ